MRSQTILTLLLLASTSVYAQDLSQLMRQKKYGDVQRIAEQRIAADAKDEQAYWYLSQSGMASAKGVAGLEKLAGKIKPCLSAIPQAPLCHLALGEVYGGIVGSSGMLKGMFYAGSIKSEFLRAVELDPKSILARRDLNEFYLLAPTAVGGSTGKAEANAKEFDALRPDLAPLLRSFLLLRQKNYDAMSQALLVPAGFSEPEAIEVHRDALASLGFSLLEEKQPAKALPVFDYATSRYPDESNFYLGAGRSQFVLDQVDKAIEALQHAIDLDPKSAAQYHLGIAQQAKGEKVAATKSLQTYLALRPDADDETIWDAQKRLKELSSH